MWDIILETIASKLLDEFAERLKEKLDDRLQTEFELLDTRLSNIERNIEKQLAMHLKAGFNFLRLGQPKEAFDEFVRAEATDADAVVAKFWLSVMAFRKGQQAFALNKLKEAIHLNPFILGDDAMTNFSQAPVMADESSWDLSLSDTTFVKRVPTTWPSYIRDQLFSGFGYRSQSAVRKISCGGGNPVVHWIIGSEILGHYYDEIISGFNLVNGACLWSRLLKGKGLCFAGARYAVLQESKPRSDFEFIDLNTGRTTRTMSKDYFETVFCPHFDLLPHLKAFAVSNAIMADASTAYRKSRDSSGRDFWFDHRSIPWKESQTAGDPLGAQIHQICAANSWFHLHFMGTQYAGAKCGLGCNASFGRLK